jgi:hypothetical protein
MATETKLDNIKDLRDQLIELFKNVKSDKIDLRKAKELNNTSGKMLSTAKLQMEYNVYTQNKAKIKFLESDD